MKQNKGNIFDIQRYSIHDGPGIRTVVFLKGCPLRCRWCANPESQSSAPQIFYVRSRCIGCRCCVGACPDSEVAWQDDGLAIDWKKCESSDLRWTDVCPTGALSVKGRWMEVSEALQEIEKDRIFYERSGGGVTLSGGEPLQQAEFAIALLTECRRAELHTAVETTGAVSFETLEDAAAVTDLFLYDIKAADAKLHREWTGAEQGLILENLRRLAGIHDNIFVRTPFIPGVNGNEDEILAIIEILKQAGIRQYDILPFHQYGSGKYVSCGMHYDMQDTQPPDEALVYKIRTLIEENC